MILLDDVGIEHLKMFGVQDPPVNYADTDKTLDIRDLEWLRLGPWSLPGVPDTGRDHKGLFPLRVNPDGSGIGVAITYEDTEWGLDSATHADLLPQLFQGLGTRPASSGSGTWAPNIRAPRPPNCVRPDLAPCRAGYDHAEVILRRHNPLPFNYYHYMVTHDDGSEEEVNGPYHTSDTVDRAKEWIMQQEAAQTPWFAWVAFFAAHAPWDCPPAELLDQDDVCRDEPPDPDETRYHFIIEALDKELGTFLTGIHWDSNPIGDPLKSKTVLFVLSDNGSPAEVAHDPVNPARAKGTVGQGGVRVPFWIGGAGVTPGEVPEGHLVTAADIYATVLHVAGMSVPPDHMAEYPDDSKSLTRSSTTRKRMCASGSSLKPSPPTRTRRPGHT